VEQASNSLTDRQTVSRPRKIQACGLLILSAILALTASIISPTKSGRFVDLDSATLGIFINNLTFHYRYDFSFSGSPEFQDQYRSWWAAAALPLTAPASGLQRLLRLPPERVDGLVRVLGIALGLLGALIAGFALAPPHRVCTRVAVVLGLTTLFPPFLLYVRTGFPNILFAFVLFWICVFLSVRYGRTSEPRFLYGLAPVFALTMVHPYPPLVILPLIPILALVVFRRIWQALRSPHLYLAGILSLLLAFGISWALAVRYVGSFSMTREQIQTFRAWRAGSVSWHQLRDVPLESKVQKLVNQHLLLKNDSLGDWTRTDRLWTVGEPHRIWWFIAPLALLGAFAGWRGREPEVVLATLILLLVLVLFFTFSFPEGRFLLVIIPCYMHLIDRGLAQVPRRHVVVGLVLVFFFGETYRLLSHDRKFEDEEMQQERIRWVSSNVLAKSGSGRSCVVFPFQQNYSDEIFFRMVTNNGSSWLKAEELPLKSGPCRSLFAVCPVASDCPKRWTAKGFRLVDSLRQTVPPLLVFRRTETSDAVGR
jgi:hypothetical protein